MTSPFNRFQGVSEEKSAGATYTPQILADFVARQIAERIPKDVKGPLRVLDPAVGDGALLASILKVLKLQGRFEFELHGFETNKAALALAATRLQEIEPEIALHFEASSFLDFAWEHLGHTEGGLFGTQPLPTFDVIIANPPYVRTQIIGARHAQLLSEQFGLTGRTDLYHAFLLAMARVLAPRGVAGMIVSNRFMTTRSGAAVRAALWKHLCLQHVWDLGDTKLFDASVLPAVILAEGRDGVRRDSVSFTSIYESSGAPHTVVADPIEALASAGFVAVRDGRTFNVQTGRLDGEAQKDAVWRISTQGGDAWLAKVEAHTVGTFRSIGKVRVGVKTCADKVFIRTDWQDTCPAGIPELLKPLTTHHVARQFRARDVFSPRSILYPHEIADGRRRAVEIDHYPRSRDYLERHRKVLEARTYVLEAGRQWFEMWVPHEPDAWQRPKLVFRDISETPTFWLDLSGSIVNGDCYWLIADRQDDQERLWLAAAVANSTFIEAFYDARFNNRLYSGRRRFITQYVEQFPLPDPNTTIGRSMVAKAKAIYERAGTPEAADLSKELEEDVWAAFGFSVKEIRGQRAALITLAQRRLGGDK